MTHIDEPRPTENIDDDSFLTRLHEAPRQEFAAALYARLTAAEVLRASIHHAAPAINVAPSTTTPRSVLPRRWSWLNRMATVSSLAATTLVVVAVSLLLLRGQFTPAATPPGTPSLASAALLYPGQLDGQTGIIVATADGEQARLLAEGEYYGVDASPDGRRFLAYGKTDVVERLAVVDLYDRTGRLLRRYDLGQSLPLIAYWSPDSRHLALYARAGKATFPQDDNFQTWLLTEDGAREVRLGGQTYVGTPSGTGAWSAQGRLLVGVSAVDSNGDGRIGPGDDQASWTVDASGGDARQLYDRGVPLGWSGTGTAVYIVEPSQILAVDAATGRRSIIANVEEVGRELKPQSPADAARLPLSTFGNIPATALVAAPFGDHFALWLTPAIAVGDATTPAPYLAIIDQQGRVVGQDRTAPGTTPQFTAWAPDARYLAYSYATAGDGAGEVRMIPIGGTQPVPPALAGVDVLRGEGLSLRWSPDGQYLAFIRDGRATVLGGGSMAEVRISPGTSSGWPDWQRGIAP